jgi:hypothetical protein
MTRNEKDRADLRRYVRNIGYSWSKASEWHEALGAEWYNEASDQVRRFADRYKIPMACVAGAAAAISPGMQWDLVMPALEALRKNPNHKVPTYCREFVNRALRCLKGEAPLDVLSGSKTRAFYLNLIGFTHTVCVDTHMMHIAEGVYHGIRNDDKAVRVTDRRYRLVVEAVEIVAKAAGVTPRELQATVWIAHREQKGVLT